MYLKEIFTEKIAHMSYLLGSENECVIIDPRRDIDIYLKEAKELNFEIKYILLTHTHADFIAGHLELAKKTNAKIILPKTAKADFTHQDVIEGDRLTIGNLSVNVLETPGHTPHHISYTIKDLERGNDIISVFTGDTLFVGGVGRPDLFPGQQEELTEKLFNSLKKLKNLPEFCEVYPAHSAGSLCGSGVEGKRYSTIGYEKKNNPFLNINNKKAFKEKILADMPEAPKYFFKCSKINEKGAHLSQKIPKLKELSLEQFIEEKSKRNSIILDIRNYDTFGAHFINSSINISLEINLPILAGSLIDLETPIFLVGDNKNELNTSKLWLNRVGYDNIVGYLEEGIFNWIRNGKKVDSVVQISGADFIELKKDNLILDIRTKKEYNEEKISNSINIPLQKLSQNLDKLDKEKQYYLLCGSGFRSSIGASILIRNGFKKVINISGGLMAINAAKEDN